MKTVPLVEVARLPDHADNVAIAIRRLEAGARLQHEGDELVLSHPILEGHRFATKLIPVGGLLLSWQLPFGKAITAIPPGTYVCNQTMLNELRIRRLDFDLPDRPNFEDFRQTCQVDPDRFRPAAQVALHAQPGRFMGFEREAGRGTGTRNFIAILGTSSRTAAYARALAERFRGVHPDQLDGVVAIAHTEGGGATPPNNFELVLRTLAGFVVHPNLGAVLAVDHGSEPINNAHLKQALRKLGYPIDSVPHQFMTLQKGFEASLDQGEAVVRGWIDRVAAARRTAQPLSRLNFALQCGGSDAFSGVSANPLVGLISKELIRHGGRANLAETPELIGAEPYVLQQVRDLEIAGAFLDQLERFQQWAAWHGHSAEGNPSGGNLYRGLYNIVIKSIGAARKKDPQVRLDYCIEYGQAMTNPGYYFMDSPGNDLESIAGQVAAGCNLILFTTGNGSITNFPFVPTIKIVTTTGRYQLLQREMDFNAGRYLDGEPMEALGQEAFELTCRVASGQRSVGETAGHSQVQLWRDWRQTNDSQLEKISKAPRPSGQPLPLSGNGLAAPESKPFSVFTTSQGCATDQIALILPTSLCSSQIGLQIAQAVNRNLPTGVTRCVALPHTEGCGVSRGNSERLYVQTMAGYLCHPMVRRALLLEHGCEKTHNDEMRRFLKEDNIDISRFGWASIQLDGGIEAVTHRVVDWFQTAKDDPAPAAAGHLGDLQLGFLADSEPPESFCESCASLAARVVEAGGTVVLTENSPLLQSSSFKNLIGVPPLPTLEYGQRAIHPGFHIMETPTDHRTEWVTGLGATGMEIMIVYTGEAPWQAHPMIPMLQVGPVSFAPDIDLVWSPTDVEDSSNALVNLVTATAGREYIPRLMAKGNTDFQITRGLVGVSL